MKLGEKRYEYSDDIESIVDMKNSTDELGIELTTSDVVLRLNQLEEEKEQQAQTIVDCQKRIAQLLCQLEDDLLT
jgi:predicted xylose isomerase-like sugar epimerase